MTASSSSILQGVLILALFCWILAKRFNWRPVRGDSRQWRLPVILIAIGVWATLGSQHKDSSGAVIAMTSKDDTYLVVGALVSLGLGMARGATLEIANHAGQMMKRYRPLTAVLWFVLIAVRLGIDLYGGHMGVSSAVIGTSIMLMFGLSLLGESLTVAMRTGAIGGGGLGGAGGGGHNVGGGRGGYDVGNHGAPEDERPRER
jgi:hypothetical protein